MKNAQDKTIPVCFSLAKLDILKGYAMSRGMTCYEQAIEELVKNLDEM